MKKSKSPGEISKSSAKPADKKELLLIGIGASAGGVKALQEFFDRMPADSGMAFVVILHLSPDYESSLPEILQNRTSMPVRQINETVYVEPNNVYVIPPNRHIEIVDGVIRPTEIKKQRGTRIVIDTFFRTLAEAYPRNAVCIVLSGTGSDGTLGLERIKESGGFAIVQDPEDAEYDNMPLSAISTNLADWVLPVAQMPEKLIAFRESSERFHLTGDDDGKVAKVINADESLREILTLLRVRAGHDFSNYKTPMLVRRIARQLQIHELEDLPTYLKLLRDNPGELLSLQRNLLINVTNFFRDKEAFESLQNEVIPNIFAGKKPDEIIRVWSAGCASGEEAYSLAILLWEYAGRQKNPPRFQVFATDVDDEAIAEARENRYPETIAVDVSPERLKRFFVRDGKHYRVRKEVRETVLFAPHNILRDPPFSRLDLIICRNVLIYLNTETKEKVMNIFHFALAPHGYLFLGSSESADNVSSLFVQINKKSRIFSRRPTVQGQYSPPQLPVNGRWQIAIAEENAERMTAPALSFSELHYKLLEPYVPASVLVNQDFDAMYMSESAGRFLRFSSGEPTNNLLKLINPDLLPDLRAALYSAQRDRKTVKFEDIQNNLNDRETAVNIIVRPVTVENEYSDYLLVIFEENKIPAAAAAENVVRILDKDEAMETIARRLEEELRRTKIHLRSTIGQNETSIEELKASNEELQAINEELRSATEELETSKEELQSVNEEMATVNFELKEKIEAVSLGASNLQNLIASTDIATIFLDRNLQIQLYTPPVQTLFNITPADINRPLEHFTNKLNYKELSDDAREVLRTLTIIEREIGDLNNRYYIARILPYRTIEDKIDGVILNFIDITRRKKAEDKLLPSEETARESFSYLNEMLESISDAFYAVDGNFNFTYVNKKAEELWKRERQSLIGKNIWEEFPQLVNEQNHKMHLEVLKTRQSVHVEVISPILDRWIEINIYPNHRDGLSIYFREITERKISEEHLRQSEERLRLLIESATDYAIFTITKENTINSWNTGATRIFGYTENEIIGESADILFTAEDRESGIPATEMKYALEIGKAENERWHIRKNGSRFFASGVLQPLSGEDGFVKICRDQTEKLIAETALKDKDLLKQLIVTQEDERRRIARDLHDQLGQQMTVLRLKLEAVKNMCSSDKICEEIENAQKIAERLDRDVDFLAWELRPAALDDLGLRLTLANFVKEWARYSDINSDFHSSGMNKLALPFEIETNLYRIAQEALNNIHKYAKAKNVSVLLEKRKNTIVMILEDDGIGFNVHLKKNRGTGIGLINMEERAKILGGTLEIESGKDRGTTIFVRVPFEPGK